MSSKIENRDGKIIFTSVDDEYELQSHPYEPCLYIRKDHDLIKVLHHAFDVYELPATFAANETVKGIDGKDYDQEAFCKVLAAAINDRRYEMDWPFAASLIEMI